MATENFRSNLKFLCGHYKSIADVCRRIGINRQQFNKYLGGQTVPTSYNLRKICEFFGVDEGEIYESHKTFIQIFKKVMPRNDEKITLNSGLSTFFPQTTAELRKYLGYYHAYVVTPSRPGFILKSITRIFEKDGAVRTKTFESINLRFGDKTLSSINKYNGYCFISSQIIYLIESECLNRRGFIYTAVYPSFRSPANYLNGLVLGISGGNFRMPFSSQIVFERLGKTPDLRKAIKECGFISMESDDISENVKSRLLVPPSPTDFNISAPIL